MTVPSRGAGTLSPAGGILVVNAGSSSLELRVLGPADEVTAALDIDPMGRHL